jgi:hypothetical protein
MQVYIKNNLERILKRMNSLEEIFSVLKEEFQFINVRLNKNLLFQAVVSYFMDIDRFKEFAETERADRHKQAGYTFKWISKIRPVQINYKQNQPQEELMFNSYFAIHASLHFLKGEAAAEISPKFLKHLIYYSIYRNISGRHFATVFYLLEANILKHNA